MVDVRQLTYFISVIEAKSFTKAAEVLHVAQPALSQQMQRLEQELGQKLMARHSRGVEPTESGLRLLVHARAIVKSIDNATYDVRHFRDEGSTVRLGMPRSLCETVGVELLRSWRHDHPRVNLIVSEQLSNTLTDWLIADRLDLALTYSPSDDDGLFCEPLLQEKLCAVTRPREQTARQLGEIRFIELAQKPLILHTPAYVNRQLIDIAAKYCSVRLNVAFEIDSIDLTLNMVEARLGYAIQPYLTVRRLMDMGQVYLELIVSPDITRRLHLAHSSRRSLSAHEIQVCDAIKTHLQRFVRCTPSPLVELEFAS
jgi:LysR family transcriptional regulator, nitrogen assimilation regulatory protein